MAALPQVSSNFINHDIKGFESLKKSAATSEMAPAPSRGHPHTPSSAGGR